MQTLPTVWLEHTTARERHIDWMVLDPTAPTDCEHRLWTLRWSVNDYDMLRQDTPFARVVEQLPHHRTIYLHYEGDIGQRRGRVKRRDACALTVLDWRQDYRALQRPANTGGRLIVCHRRSHTHWHIEVAARSAVNSQ